MKLGVIIQGPLISFGQGPNNSNGGFDTLAAILENVARLNKHDLCYIVSTWSPSSEQEQSIFNALEKVNITLLHNLSPQLFDPDHRYKQHYGVLKGAEALLQKCGDITHLVKIRTDMLMPEAFWEWAYVISGINEKKLYVSELMNRPFYQGDFIYLANRESFLAFLTTVTNYKSRIIHPSIAFDMGIKNCEARNFGVIYGRGYFGRIRFLIDFFLRTDTVRKYWNQFISKHIGVLPEVIWIDIKWRDRRIGSFLEGSWFKFDNSEITQGIAFRKNMRTLIREYKTYWAKCSKSQKKIILVTTNRLAMKIYKNVSRAAQKLGQYINAQIFRKRQKILGRVACLGNDLYALRYQRKYGFRLINQQKVRVDLWLEWSSNSAKPRPELVKSHMSRPDVYPLIENQAALPWLAERKFEFLLMDSFAELTDQKFTHRKEGWSFCCHYSDLKHSDDFDADFEGHGLLPIGDIEAAYTRFFEWFEKEHAGKEVIFLHFPTALDERTLYKERGAEILRAITKLQSNKPFIHNVSVDDNSVGWNENDRFPYHFSKSTNLAFVERWNKLNK